MALGCSTTRKRRKKRKRRREEGNDDQGRRRKKGGKGLKMQRKGEFIGHGGRGGGLRRGR